MYAASFFWTRFVQAQIFPCHVRRESPALATRAVAFALGEKVVGLNGVDELVELSHPAVNHVFRRDERIVGED